VGKILIVEDNKDFRQTLHTSLNNNIPGVMLYEVANGLEAVRKANDLFPDIVLMDIGLPKMNGFEVTRNLKRSEIPSWIIIITGKDSPEYVKAAQNSGANYFLSKYSVKLEEIICLVKDLLNHDDALPDKWNKFRL
jgi:DNA-binding NarL/FixJ family response regulator